MTGDLADAGARLRARGLSIGGPVSVVFETGSTNDDAKRAAKDGAPHGAVFVAESQTKGRGRKGRAWSSPPGENLLFSVVLRVACPPSRVPPLSLACGLAVSDAVAKAAPRARVWTKWPNDVWAAPPKERGVPPKKVAGILIESMLRGGKVEALVVGIGLNVSTEVFGGELRDRATSLLLIKEPDERVPPRSELLVDVLARLDWDLTLAAGQGLGPLAARLRRADLLAGRRVRTEDGLEGVAESIDDDGRLIVRADDGGRHHLVAGDVNLIAFDRE